MKHSKLRSATMAIGLLLATANLAYAVDNDMDTYHTPLDCDDNNPSVNPGAMETVADGIDQDCDGDESCYVDGDEDNYRPGTGTTTVVSLDLDCEDPGEARASDPPGDCDDGDPNVNPGGTEICDGGDVDEDCDTAADDFDTEALGKTSWYADADGDGYGDASSSVLACDAPSGHVANASDCNDASSAVNPSETEVCDAGNVDDDCDGLADDQDSGVTGQTTWYTDGDSDGYGDPSDGVLACDAPTDTVPEGTDCDDGDASVHPSAIEVCDAGNRDDDCDGLADDLDPDATGETPWFTDGDSDGHGDASDAVFACDAPSGRVGNGGDCDDSDPDFHPGATETCTGDDPNDYNCDGSAGCADATCSSEPACSGTVEVFDHLECFKIKPTDKLKGVIDLDPGTSPPFTLSAGCKLGKASRYCVPVMKTVAVLDATSTVTEDAAYEGQELEDDRICYKVKCADTSVTSITITGHNRFGDQNFEKFKTSEICAPATRLP